MSQPCLHEESHWERCCTACGMTRQQQAATAALASVDRVAPVAGAVAQDGPGNGPHSAAAGFAGPDAGTGSREPESGAQRADAYRDAVVRLTHELLTVSRQNERLAAWVQRERDIADRRQAERDRLRSEVVMLKSQLVAARAEADQLRERLEHLTTHAKERADEHRAEMETVRGQALLTQMDREQAEPADDCLRTADEVRVRGTGRCGWCSYPAAAHPEAGPLAGAANLDYAEDRTAAARRDDQEVSDAD